MKLLSRYDLGLFIIRLRQTTSGGASVACALERVAIVEANDNFRHFLQNASTELKNGATLGEALFPATGHPFPGFLQQILSSVEDYENSLEKALDLSSEYLTLRKSSDTRAELIVNIMIVLGPILFFIFIAVVVIPPFEAMYAGLGQELPAPTQIIISLSQFINGYLFIALLALGGLSRYICRFDKRRILDADRVLIFKHLATKIEQGLPIAKALESTADIASKNGIQGRLQTAAHRLANGSTFVYVLKESGLLHPFSIQLLDVEQQNTENIVDGLLSISRYHASRAQTNALKQNVYITANLLLCIGVIIVTIIAMYLPILSLASVVG